MELLTTALVIFLLSTTASAKPIGWPRHQDADIPDNDLTQGWLDGNDRRFWQSDESSSNEDSSSESNQSLDSRESSESSESSESQSSEESSEEIGILDRTTPVVSVMTSVTTEEGSTPTSEPDTMSTDEPGLTPPPGTLAPPVVTTSPGCVTHFFTEEIPITESRGDN